MPTKTTKVKKELDANDLADLIAEKRLKSQIRAYDVLKKKCLGAISVMAAEEEESTTVDLSQDDLMGLSKVTEELRSLGYRFRFTERVTVNEDGDELGVENTLFISLKHLL